MSVNVRRIGARDQRVQRLRRLLRRSSVRDSEHAFVAEGVRLVEAALDAGVGIEGLFVAADWQSSAPTAAVVERASAGGVAVFELATGIMERVADTVSPQPVCAVIRSVDLGVDELLSRPAPGSGHEPGLGSKQEPGQGSKQPPRQGSGQSLVLVCVDVARPREPGRGAAHSGGYRGPRGRLLRRHRRPVQPEGRASERRGSVPRASRGRPGAGGGTRGTRPAGLSLLGDCPPGRYRLRRRGPRGAAVRSCSATRGPACRSRS